MTAEALDAVAVKPRVVAVDGIPMSGVLAQVPNPRATLVAVHGGATTSAYFNCPGFPQLSLLRLGAALGFTVLAIDRPGFGASALYSDEFDQTPRRIDLAYRAIEAMLGDGDRGAGLFMVAHSNGCELTLRMAADPRGSELLGIELSGTGIRQQARAREILAGASRTNIPAGLRELLWEPADLYPEGVDRAVRTPGGPSSPDYEEDLVRHWLADFPALAAQVRVPVRFTVAEHERVWENDPDALADIVALFSDAPRAFGYRQGDGGHNLSLSSIAPEYHLSILSFVEQCMATTDSIAEAK